MRARLSAQTFSAHLINWAHFESYEYSKLVDVTVSDPKSRFPLNLMVSADLYIIEVIQLYIIELLLTDYI